MGPAAGAGRQRPGEEGCLADAAIRRHKKRQAKRNQGAQASSEQQKGPEEKKIPANSVSQAFGLVGGIVTFFGFYTVKKFKRRTLLIFGFASLTVCLFLMALFIALKDGYLLLVSLLMYQICFSLFHGPILWVYMPEVTSDA